MSGEPSPLVLVTGGAGFIGSHTVDRLVAVGCRVVVLDDFSTGGCENLAHWSGDARVEIVEADIAEGLHSTLATRHSRLDAIVHLAAQTSVTRSIEDPLGDIRVNYAGTVQILEHARRTGAPMVVFASSAAVYGDAADLPVSEDATLRPLSPYGANKLGAERFLECYGSLWGLRWTAFRFFNVYGPRQDPASPYSGVISIFAKRALAGEPLTIHGDGGQTRDFVFVGDVAGAIADACLKEVAAGAIVNLGTGIETSIHDLARLILELTGAGTGLRHGPPLAGEVRRSVANISRAKELLGFEPKTSLRHGLRQTLEWLRSAGDGR